MPGPDQCERTPWGDARATRNAEGRPFRLEHVIVRTAAAVFVASHGIGYIIWFMSAWTPSALQSSKNLTFASKAPATGMLGKALGLVSLAVLAGFVASAWGICQETSWWPVSLIGSIVASTPVALAVWNPVGIVSLLATLANVGLLAATLMPWGRRFFPPH